MPRSKRSIALIILAITALACAIPGLSAPDTSVVSTSAAETVLAGLTQNVTDTSVPGVTPSLTPTFTPTLIYLTPRFPSEMPTNTLPPGTETSTPEPTATLPPIEVEIRVTRPTHCRSGPGTSYEIVGSFLVGMKAPVIGRDPTSQFWYIPNPYVFTDYCWVSGKYAEFSGGNQLLIPVITPAPPPTSTGTAIPSLEFKLQPSGLQTCNGTHWVNIEIMNLSNYTFSWVKIEVQDTVNNVFRSVTYNNFPYSTNCDGLKIVETIFDNGGVAVVSGPRFEYNLRGNKLFIYVTICSEKDQKGVCTKRELKYTP